MFKLIIGKVRGPCQYKGCKEKAVTIAAGRKYRKSGHPKPAVYCDEHADAVAEEGFPEYTNECPNCGCRSGVN